MHNALKADREIQGKAHSRSCAGARSWDKQRQVCPQPHSQCVGPKVILGSCFIGKDIRSIFKNHLILVFFLKYTMEKFFKNAFFPHKVVISVLRLLDKTEHFAPTHILLSILIFFPLFKKKF